MGIEGKERGTKGKGRESGKYEREVRKGKVERSGKRREGSRGQEKEEKENITSYLLLSDSYYSRCHIRIYGGASVLQSPLGPNKLS